MALITALPADHREIFREKYVLAVDIGQSSDPTAVAAIHHTGLVTLLNEERKKAACHRPSRDRRAPSVHRRGAEAAVRRR